MEFLIKLKVYIIILASTTLYRLYYVSTHVLQLTMIKAESSTLIEHSKGKWRKMLITNLNHENDLIHKKIGRM